MGWDFMQSQPICFKQKVEDSNECTEKTTREEQVGVYVGVWAQPTPPHIPLLSQLILFQWILQCYAKV